MVNINICMSKLAPFKISDYDLTGSAEDHAIMTQLKLIKTEFNRKVPDDQIIKEIKRLNDIMMRTDIAQYLYMKSDMTENRYMQNVLRLQPYKDYALNMLDDHLFTLVNQAISYNYRRIAKDKWEDADIKKTFSKILTQAEKFADAFISDDRVKVKKHAKEIYGLAHGILTKYKAAPEDHKKVGVSLVRLRYMIYIYGWPRRKTPS